MYKSKNTVRLPDTDAAGIVFYANYYRLAHEAYEAFMEAIDFSLTYVIDESDISLLIVHCEADYTRSLRLGEEYSVSVNVDGIGRTSFVLSYTFESSPGETIAELKTVHVAVDKSTNKKTNIPDSLRKKLLEHA